MAAPALCSAALMARRDAKRSAARFAVDLAIQKIRDYYATGRSFADEDCDAAGRLRPGRLRMPPGQGPAKWSSEQQKLRRARAFAKAYNRAQLKQLCRLCREYECALGLTVIDRLVRVPLPHRQTLQTRAIAGHWSRRTLDAEIYGHWHRYRENVGHPGRGLAGPAQARYELYRLCGVWRRWYEALRGLGSSNRPNPLGKLPATLEKAFGRMAAQIREIHLRLQPRPAKGRRKAASRGR